MRAFRAQLPLSSAPDVIAQHRGSADLPPKHPDKAEHTAHRALLTRQFKLRTCLFFSGRFCNLIIHIILSSGCSFLPFEFIFPDLKIIDFISFGQIHQQDEETVPQIPI